MNTKIIILLIALLSVCLLGGVAPLYAREKTKTAAHKTLPDGFIQLPGGFQYKVITHGTGTRRPKISDHVELGASYRIRDSVMYDSWKVNHNLPVTLSITKPDGYDDPIEIFMLMVVGDSVVAKFPVDSFKKQGQAPAWARSGDVILYKIKMFSIKSEQEYKKEEKEVASKQKAIDDQLMQEYFKKNNLHPKKTPSGLYYSITKEGHGANIKKGEVAAVNYTGWLLNGKKFDSNTDTAFHHAQPLSLEAGAGSNAKGANEGILLLKAGSKATLYMPSALAYGPKGNRQVPENTVVVCDLDILSVRTQTEVRAAEKKETEQKNKEAKLQVIKQAATDDRVLRDLFVKINIKPSKTASGLYYVITNPGTGDIVRPGKKVAVNYTARTIDGKVFDSNTDPQYNHVQPYTFILGEKQVIRGWEEGVQLLRLGGKITFSSPQLWPMVRRVPPIYRPIAYWFVI